MNMIESAKAQVRQLTVAAYEKAAAAGLLPAGIAVEPAVEIPKDTANGDYTTTFLRGDRRSRLYELPPGRKVVRRHRLRH